jgi:hypothetical protein
VAPPLGPNAQHLLNVLDQQGFPILPHLFDPDYNQKEEYEFPDSYYYTENQMKGYQQAAAKQAAEKQAAEKEQEDEEDPVVMVGYDENGEPIFRFLSTLLKKDDKQQDKQQDKKQDKKQDKQQKKPKAPETGTQKYKATILRQVENMSPAIKQRVSGHLNEDCVICSDEFKDDELLIRLPCHHVFHRKCILQAWIDAPYSTASRLRNPIKKRVCPSCRAEIPPTFKTTKPTKEDLK